MWAEWRYKDSLKENLKKCGLQPNSLSNDRLDRDSWHSQYHKAIARLETSHAAPLVTKCTAHKQAAQSSKDVAILTCSRCRKLCTCRIRLYSNQSTHPSMMLWSVDLDRAVCVLESCVHCQYQTVNHNHIQCKWHTCDCYHIWWFLVVSNDHCWSLLCQIRWFLVISNDWSRSLCW